MISEVSSSLDKFLVALLDGEYDKEEQKTKVCWGGKNYV